MRIKDKVMKLAYIVPGGAGGAPLELFDPNDLVDFVNAEIIAELERVPGKLDDLHQGTEGAGFVHYGEFGEYLDDRLKKLKAKETQL